MSFTPAVIEILDLCMEEKCRSSVSRTGERSRRGISETQIAESSGLGVAIGNSTSLSLSLSLSLPLSLYIYIALAFAFALSLSVSLTHSHSLPPSDSHSLSTYCTRSLSLCFPLCFFVSLCVPVCVCRYDCIYLLVRARAQTFVLFITLMHTIMLKKKYTKKEANCRPKLLVSNSLVLCMHFGALFAFISNKVVCVCMCMCVCVCVFVCVYVYIYVYVCMYA